MTDLFKKTAIFSLSVITAIGMMGAIAAPSTANAQSLSSSQIDSIISLLQSFGADQGTIDNVEASLMGEAPSGNDGTTGNTSDMTTKCDFNRDLSTGSQGSDVKCLQEYLNNSGYTVSASGPGAPGNETEYFGPRTKQAVVAWQNANATDVLQPVGLSSGTGYWGPSSIDHYNQLAAQAAADDGSDDSDTAGTPDSGVDVSTDVMNDVSVPRNANLIKLAEFDFASGENTTIEGLHFERKGAGNRGDWDKLYVYEGDERLTSGRTIDTNSGLDFSNLDVDLDDGEMKTLTLRGTLAASSNQSGNVHYFELESVDFDDSTEASNLPLITRTISVSSVEAGDLAVNENSLVDTSVQLGDSEVEIYNTDLTMSNEDADIESIILNQLGTIDMEDLDNYSAEVDGESVGLDINVDGDEVAITFDDPYYLEEGDNVELALYADMSSAAYIKGGAGTINLDVDESNDVYAVGRDFGYGVTVSLTSNSDEITLEASELNFSFNGPQTNDISLNAEDVVLFDADVAAQADYEVEDLSFEFAMSGNTSKETHLRNIRLINGDTGNVYAGPDEISATSTTVEHTFDDVFVINSGDSNLQVVADIGNDTDNNAEVTVTMLIDKDGSGTVDTLDLDAENLNTSEAVDLDNDVVPAGTIAGNKQTFTQPDLSISNSSTPVDQTYVVGKSNAVLGAYVLDANNLSSIDVRQLDMRVAVSTGTVRDLAGTFSLHKNSADGTVIASESTDASANDSISFDTSGKLDIAANDEVVVYLVGDLKSDAPTGGSDTATSSITGVSAQDSNSNDPLANGGDIDNFTDIDGNTFTIANSGSFDTVAFSGNNPSEDTVITPGGDVLFSSYRLRPQNEDIEMKDFVVSIGDSTESKYFDRVKTFFDGNQVGNDGETINADSETYDSVNQVLTKGEDTIVDMKATLNSISSNLESGAELQLYFATSTGNYDIVGVDSDQQVTFPTSSIDGATDGLRTYQIANSYPSIEFTGSDATLTSGQKNLYKFTVTAENDDIELRELTFEVSTSEATTTGGDLEVGSLELLKNGSQVGTATSTFTVGTGTTSETGLASITISNVSDYTIGSGDTATFTLRGDVSGIASDDANSISSSLDDSDEGTALANEADAASVNASTVWSDYYRYFNGAYLDYPTDSQTLSL